MTRIEDAAGLISCSEYCGGISGLDVEILSMRRNIGRLLLGESLEPTLHRHAAHGCQIAAFDIRKRKIEIQEVLPDMEIGGLAGTCLFYGTKEEESYMADVAWKHSYSTESLAIQSLAVMNLHKSDQCKIVLCLMSDRNPEIKSLVVKRSVAEEKLELATKLRTPAVREGVHCESCSNAANCPIKRSRTYEIGALAGERVKKVLSQGLDFVSDSPETMAEILRAIHDLKLILKNGHVLKRALAMHDRGVEIPGFIVVGRGRFRTFIPQGSQRAETVLPSRQQRRAEIFHELL